MRLDETCWVRNSTTHSGEFRKEDKHASGKVDEKQFGIVLDVMRRDQESGTTRWSVVRLDETSTSFTLAVTHKKMGTLVNHFLAGVY